MDSTTPATQEGGSSCGASSHGTPAPAVPLPAGPARLEPQKSSPSSAARMPPPVGAAGPNRHRSQPRPAKPASNSSHPRPQRRRIRGQARRAASRQMRRPWSPTDPLYAAARVGHPHPWLGSTCTSPCCRPGAVRLPCRQQYGPVTPSPARPPFGWKPGWTRVRCTGSSPRPSPAPTDTAGALLERLSIAGFQITCRHHGRHRRRLRGRSPTVGRWGQPRAQDHRRRSRDRLVATGHCDRPADPLRDPDLTRAPGWPHPGAELGVGPVAATDVEGLANGEIRAEKRQVLVGTGSTAVRLGELQPQGRKSMAAADWARGQRAEAGTVLTDETQVSSRVATRGCGPVSSRRSRHGRSGGRPTQGPRGGRTADGRRGGDGPPRRPQTRRPPDIDHARRSGARPAGRGAGAQCVRQPLRCPACSATAACPAGTRRHPQRPNSPTAPAAPSASWMPSSVPAVTDRWPTWTARSWMRFRLAAYQLLHTRIPDHAAVSVTVDLVEAGRIRVRPAS